MNTFSVLLHNIRSVYNVGSIFRTADGAGFDKVYLSGYTPLPIDRFGRQRKDMNKVALGAEQTLNWQVLEDDILDFIKAKKEQGAVIIAAEQSPQSISYDHLTLPESGEVILIMGEEVSGIEPELLEQVDFIAEIPMRGAKESLNVATSFGVLAYELTKD